MARQNSDGDLLRLVPGRFQREKDPLTDDLPQAQTIVWGALINKDQKSG
jgi:hypothetical protein